MIPVKKKSPLSFALLALFFVNCFALFNKQSFQALMPHIHSFGLDNAKKTDFVVPLLTTCALTNASSFFLKRISASPLKNIFIPLCLNGISLCAHNTREKLIIKDILLSWHDIYNGKSENLTDFFKSISKNLGFVLGREIGRLGIVHILKKYSVKNPKNLAITSELLVNIVGAIISRFVFKSKTKPFNQSSPKATAADDEHKKELEKKDEIIRELKQIKNNKKNINSKRKKDLSAVKKNNFLEELLKNNIQNSGELRKKTVKLKPKINAPKNKINTQKISNNQSNLQKEPDDESGSEEKLDDEIPPYELEEYYE